MITIDISAAVHARAGLGRYTQQLARALVAEAPNRFGFFYNQGADGHFPADLPTDIPQRSVNLGYKPWRSAVFAGQRAGVGFNRLVPDATLFHATEHLLLPLRGVPTVLTVHDLIFKLFPEYHKKLNYWYLNAAMPLFCRKADAIIAVSEATKQDLIDHYAIDPAKIHVVHEAAAAHFGEVSAEAVAAVRQRYELPDQYLIHLSTIEPRKNLNRLVDALLALRERWPELHLVLAGGKGWLYDDFFAKIDDLGLSGIVRPLGWVPDEDLPAVLAGAALGVQPSLYEGFGLPILELMTCGQVVAASNRSSLPEVGGEAAAYFDPTDVGEMVAVVDHLLSDEQERARRRDLGREQARQFSWERAARETTAVYESILR